VKTCDKNLAFPKMPEELCGKPAAVESSLGKRHRCGDHHEGPGWRELILEKSLGKPCP
jgi:hypothetical protein